MTHMVPEDEAVLMKWLGGNIPDLIQDEYAMRIHLLHTGGQVGPLGILGLVDMVRFLNVNVERPAPPPAPDASEIDWLRLPNDGSVSVMAGPFLGEMHPGRFLGRLSNGKLNIRMSDDERVVEVPTSMVEYNGRGAPTEVQSAPEEAPEAVELDGPDSDVHGNYDDAVRWEEVPKDTTVYVQDGDNEAIEGLFKGIDEEGKVKVKLPKQIAHLRADKEHCHPELQTV